MRKFLSVAVLFSFLAVGSGARAAGVGGNGGGSGSFGKVGDWIGGGGLGLTISPTLFLINPQLEYVWKPNVYVGPMIQLAPGDFGVLISVGGTIRTLLGHHPRVKPSVEGGLGFAVASAGYASSVGVNIHFGMGFDYLIQHNFTLGTMIRANFAPPMKTFYLSWPLLMARFIL